MNSGNHHILYKCPHPDFFRKMFTLCFCLSQNVSPVISPWFRNFLFPVPPSFSCQWSVLGPHCSRRHCVHLGQGKPPSPHPHRTPSTAGWSSTHTLSDPPSKLPLPLDGPSSVPHSFPAPGQPSHCLGYSPILQPLGIPPQLHLHPEDFLPWIMCSRLTFSSSLLVRNFHSHSVTAFGQFSHKK